MGNVGPPSTFRILESAISHPGGQGNGLKSWDVGRTGGGVKFGEPL